MTDSRKEKEMEATQEVGEEVRALEMLTGAERRQVMFHQRELSEARGSAVSFEEARDDWLAYHAQTWRQARQREVLALQLEEIRKHKWIESEKAKQDLGNEAVLDWIKHHAARWRQWYEREQERENC